MRIIVAGAGKVGSRLIRVLASDGHDVTLIDNDNQALQSVCEQYDVLGLEGNCASMQVLKDAGIEQTELLIAVTNADEINLLCCVTGKKLNPELHTVARIRNPEYTDQVYDMQDVFGLSLIVNPEKDAAHEIEQLLKYPGFLQRDSFARGRAEIVEIEVSQGSALAGRPMKDITEIVKRQVLVCAAIRDGKALMPKGGFVPQAGDRLFLAATSRDLRPLLKNLNIISRKVKRVMLCGGGKISYYLAEALEKSDIRAEIIDKDEERCQELSRLLPETTVILGDASEPDTLMKEGLDDCDSLVALTGMDELNVLLSLFAKNHGVPQVITKQGHSEALGEIAVKLSLGSIISPKEICCDTIVRYVRSMRDQSGATAVTVQTIADGKVEASEFIINKDSLHRGEALKDLPIKEDVLVAAISRGRSTRIAGGLSSFEEGDSVIVISGGEPICRFNDIFQ